MTVEEAIAILIREIEEDPFVTTEYREKIHEALKMAIKALEQTDVLDKIMAEIEQVADEESTEDFKWALGLRYSMIIIDKYRKEQTGETKTIVHGEWICEKGFTADTWECNQCHEVQTNKSKYCPSCGAKMEKGDT